MTKPKNTSLAEWRLRVNARYQRRKEVVSKRNAGYRLKNPSKFMYAEAKKRAKKAGIEFNIEIEDVRVPLLCPLLGILLVSNAGNKKFSQSSPSLDRIDNTKGYVKGNVRVISDMANRMKREATAEQLRIFAMSILIEQGFIELEY